MFVNRRGTFCRWVCCDHPCFTDDREKARFSMIQPARTEHITPRVFERLRRHHRLHKEKGCREGCGVGRMLCLAFRSRSSVLLMQFDCCCISLNSPNLPYCGDLFAPKTNALSLSPVPNTSGSFSDLFIEDFSPARRVNRGKDIYIVYTQCGVC